MCRIIACITSDSLSMILRSPAVINLQVFVNLEMPEHVFDNLWSEDGRVDLVIIDRGIIDYDDVVNSAKSNPSTAFIVKSSETIDTIPQNNVILFRDTHGLTQALSTSKPLAC